MRLFLIAALLAVAFLAAPGLAAAAASLSPTDAPKEAAPRAVGGAKSDTLPYRVVSSAAACRNALPVLGAVCEKFKFGKNSVIEYLPFGTGGRPAALLVRYATADYCDEGGCLTTIYGYNAAEKTYIANGKAYTRGPAARCGDGENKGKGVDPGLGSTVCYVFN